MTAEINPYHEAMQALGTKRLFTDVPLDQLRIDTSYQRTINVPKRIRDMAARYDERLMGVLVCSVRPDGIYVIDGHHRLEMVRLLKHEKVLCELFTGLSIQDEATMFYNLDTARVGLSGEALFRALMVAKEPNAVAIAAAIEDAGFRVSFTGNIVNGVRCFKTLLYQARVNGIESVRSVLSVLAEAWRGHSNVAPASVIEGMTLFLRSYPDIDQKELSRQLSRTTPQELASTARGFTQSMSWNTSESMARAILAAYNAHRHSASRLEDVIDGAVETRRKHMVNLNRTTGYQNKARAGEPATPAMQAHSDE